MFVYRMVKFLLFVLTAVLAWGQHAVFTTQNPTMAVARTGPGYDYVPTVMFDGKYKMWWCGSRSNYPGDHIFYAEATSLAGPWTAPGSNVPHSFAVALAPSHITGRFDADHTCDPTVIRAGSEYYMFYGGTHNNAPAQASTAIGVAKSTNGINWVRLNNGHPILSSHPSRYPYAATRPYGTGQPSVVFMNGWFYMLHTDHLGLASNSGNGAGQYALRSQDPLFLQGVQAMTTSGWMVIADQAAGVPEAQTRYEARTSYSMVEAFSVDWTFADMINAFIIARHNEAGVTDFTVTSNLDYGHQNLNSTRLMVPGAWVDGPAIVRRPDGHAMAATTCGEVPLELMRSAGADVWTSQLTATGAVLGTPGAVCTGATWGGVFNTWKVATPGAPLMVVVNGTRLQFALQAPADLLSKNTFWVPPSIYHQIWYGASLYHRNTVWGTAGSPAAFLMDDGRLWPVSCLQLITSNGSSITGVTAQQYAQKPKGPPLFCVQ